MQIFGKTIENVRKHSDKFVITNKRRNYLVSTNFFIKINNRN